MRNPTAVQLTEVACHWYTCKSTMVKRLVSTMRQMGSTSESSSRFLACEITSFSRFSMVASQEARSGLVVCSGWQDRHSRSSNTRRKKMGRGLGVCLSILSSELCAYWLGFERSLARPGMIPPIHSHSHRAKWNISGFSGDPRGSNVASEGAMDRPRGSH